MGLNFGRIKKNKSTSFIICIGISEHEKNIMRRAKSAVLDLQEQNIAGTMDRSCIPRHGGTDIFVFVLCPMYMCCQKPRNLIERKKKSSHRGAIHFILIF